MRAGPLRGEALGWSPWGHRVPCPGGATPKLNAELRSAQGGGPALGLPRPLEGASRRCARPGLPRAARQLLCRPGGLHQRRVCPVVPGGAHTGVHSSADAHKAHTWATNRPVRPRACLGLWCGHVLGHVLAPRTHSGRHARRTPPLSQPTPEPLAAPEPAALPSKQDQLS